MGTRPCPLEVMATEMARYINAFTNEIKTGMGLGHHGLTVESPGIDTPQHDLRFFPAQGSQLV